jgi:hypothetical protein
MPVLFIVIGLLLMLFGGGCSLIVGGVLLSDPSMIMNELASIFPLYLAIGLAPLVGGFFLFRHGLRQDRERRQAAMTKIDGGDKA